MTPDGSGTGPENRGRLQSRGGRHLRPAPYALLPQLAEQRIFNPKVVGSSPSWRTIMLRVAQLARAPDCGSGGRRFKSAHALHGTLAQLVERQTEDLRVSGSIPEGPTRTSKDARAGDCAGLLATGVLLMQETL